MLLCLFTASNRQISSDNQQFIVSCFFLYVHSVHHRLTGHPLAVYTNILAIKVVFCLFFPLMIARFEVSRDSLVSRTGVEIEFIS